MATEKHSIFYTTRGHKAAQRLAAGGLPKGMVLDSQGRPVSINPRTKGAISIGDTEIDSIKQAKIKRGCSTI